MTILKPLTVWITMNSEKFLKWWGNNYTLPVSWETCMWVKKQQLEPYMEKLTGSKLGKGYNKPGYCCHVCLTYMQSTSCKMFDWMKHKLELRFPGEISVTSVCRWQHLYSRKWRRTKEPLLKVKEESEEVGLELNIQQTKIMASGAITSWQIDGETVADFIFQGSKNHCRWWLQPWN